MDKSLKTVFAIVVTVFVLFSIFLFLKPVYHENYSGKVIDVDYNENTIIKFEDGKVLIFRGVINNLEIGKNYTIHYYYYHKSLVDKEPYEFDYYHYEPEYSIEWIPPSEDD